MDVVENGINRAAESIFGKRRRKSAYHRYTIVKRLDPEEQIRSRLREIAKDTRRARQELEEIIWKTPERTRVFANDRGPRLRRRKQGK